MSEAGRWWARWGGCSLVVLLCAQTLTAAELPRLAWQARSDWLNVRQLGARGDGRADDTAAFQKAFDQVTSGSTVYLPRGTYRITKSLTLTGPALGVLVVGHGRDTRLVWDGQAGGRIVHDDGLSASRYVGIDFDGRGKAAVGLYHHSMKRFETEVEHRHLAFRNFTDAGLLAAPGDRFALAETTMENCLFEDCRRGAAFVSFNDYNWTFDRCEFARCDVAIDCRHGNFYVRNCHFQESRTVDVLAQPEHACSIRRSTSLGSARFLDFANSVSPMTIQDCHVAGWKAPDGAVRLNGAPVTMFDCSFADVPNTEAPVRVLNANQRLILSENVVEGGGALLSGGSEAFVFRVPAGRRKGSLRSAEQRFFSSTARVPGKVFDAKRDFGARGDRKTDDTQAVQQTIDAARAFGRGAIAYLPTGDYVITKTLTISGKDFYVGGSGFYSRLIWRGEPGGTMVAIRQPQHVTLEHLAIGNHDSGPMENGIDVLQQGGRGPTHMTCDGVFVFGMYQKQPLRKGLHLVGLGPNETVVVSGLQGNLRVIDSAAATILARTSFEGSVIVEGRDARRGGLLGFLTRLSTITRHGLYVRDNHSVVMSDYYIEQADNGFLFEGSAGGPPGRITLQGGKLHFNVPRDKPSEGTAVALHGYRGRVFLGHSQFYNEPKQVRIVQSGTAPAELVIWGSLFYGTELDVKAGDSLSTRLVGNQSVGQVSAAGEVTYGHAPEDADAAAALQQVCHALDDLRRLGEVDLQLSETAP